MGNVSELAAECALNLHHGKPWHYGGSSLMLHASVCLASRFAPQSCVQSILWQVTMIRLLSYINQAAIACLSSELLCGIGGPG
jgi:hypothetical protein